MRIRLRRSSTSAPESTTGDVTERHRRPWANVRYPPDWRGNVIVGLAVCAAPERMILFVLPFLQMGAGAEEAMSAGGLAAGG